MARRHPEVAYTYTTVGSAPGRGADNATVYVRLVPKHQRAISQDAFGQLLRTELAHIGGATAYTFAAGGFAGNQKQMQLQLQGPDANALAHSRSRSRIRCAPRRARWTSVSRRADRSRSSTCNRGARSPGRSA